MADLEPRVNQLEEDVAILKGEIKSVLMEVRASLLSQTNPFSPSSLTPPSSIAAAHVAPAAALQPEPVRRAEPEAPRYAGPAPEMPAVREEVRPDERPQQIQNRNDIAKFPQAAQPDGQLTPQQPVPLSVASRRSWELNTLAMLLAWCQGNMVRLSDKEMTSLLALARYGGLVDEELEQILLDISNSFDEGKEGRAATVSEYLLALHELHTVIREEEEPAIPRLRRVS